MFPDAHCVRAPGKGGAFIVLPLAGPFEGLDKTSVVGFGKSERAAWRMASRRVKALPKGE